MNNILLISVGLSSVVLLEVIWLTHLHTTYGGVLL